MNVASRVLKNTIALYAANFVYQIVAFLINIYIARKMGATIFGQFAFAATFASYFAILADPGINQLAQRDTARSPDKTQEYGGTVLLIRIGTSVIAFLLLTIIAFSRFENLKLLLTLSYGLALFSTSISLSWVFVARERMKFAAIISSLISVLNLVLIILFTQFTTSLLVFPLALLGANIVGALLSISLFLKFYGRLKLLREDRLFWKKFLEALWPFALSGIVIATYFRLGTLILGFTGRDTEAGWYNAAYKLIFMLQMLGSTYFTALFPTISRLFVTSKLSLSRLSNMSVELWASLGIPLVVGGTIIARPLINSLYSGKFTESIIIWQILLLAVLATYLSGTYAYLLLASDRQSAYLRSITIAMLISLFVYFLLMPIYGAIGAAIGYTCAELIGLLLVYKEANKFVEIRLFRYLTKPLLASLLMAVVMLALSQISESLWLLQVVIGVVVYFLALWAIGGINSFWVETIKKLIPIRNKDRYLQN